MEQMTKENLVELLKHEILDIEFTKVDGTTRRLKGTLKESYTKAAPEKKTDRIKRPNEQNISVWDVESNGWRSFKYDNVISVSRNQIAHY